MRQKRLLMPPLVAGAFLFLLLGVVFTAAAQDEVPTAATCGDCHTERVESFADNPHSVLNQADQNLFGVDGASCASCHKGAAEHVAEGGGMDAGPILAFDGEQSAKVESEACLQCHGDTHPRFFTSEHAQAGVACTSCHQIHQPAHGAVTLLKAGSVMTSADPASKLDPASQVCAQCHSEVLAKFQFNERHRLQEGVLSCVTCHDPHERATRGRLGGFKHQQVCMKCHTDKGGPFIFEHGSSRVEGCTACHDPHGSPNRHMLLYNNLGQLCYSCHAEVPGFHTSGAPDNIRFGEDANCTNCHSSIHGSNFDPFFLK